VNPNARPAAGGQIVVIESCGSPKLDRPDHLDFSTAWKEQSGNMLAILLGLFQLIWLGRGHHAVVLENLALRQQLVFTNARKSVSSQNSPSWTGCTRPIQPALT